MQIKANKRLFPQEENGKDMSWSQLKTFEKQDYQIIDIRDSVVFQTGNIPGSINIPFPKEAAKLYQIPRDKALIVCCQKGEISSEIVELLADAEYEAYNLTDGFCGWLKDQLKSDKQ